MRRRGPRFTICLNPEPDGGFTVTVPALPGCVTWGKDLAEARAMAQEAILAYVASLKKHGEPVPAGDEALVTHVEVATTNG